jgi:UDP-N-acetylmuramyl pentapeptide phosphotransferase/UDP-N-acetylglucosamine-1-phosphate transferase
MYILLALTIAAIVTYFAVPSIILVARTKHLCDEPGERRSHTVSTPSLGGIGIFAGTLVATLIAMPRGTFDDLQFMLAALIILFFVGLRDDIIEVRARWKLLAQIVAAGILAVFSNIHITSLYGVFGIYELPQWFAIPFTIFTIIVIINAFNLIDGINGLAASIAALACLTLGGWFLLVGRMELATLAFATVGALLAFLHYNLRAKIFMGDTGSLTLGLLCSILVISFMEYNDALLQAGRPYAIKSGPAVAIGIIILPLFDTLRVFLIRLSKGLSPFYPDRNHIHHLLLDMGLSHSRATGILLAVSVAFLGLVYFFQDLGSLSLILLVLFVACLMLGSLYLMQHRRRRRRVAEILAKRRAKRAERQQREKEQQEQERRDTSHPVYLSTPPPVAELVE